VGVEDILLRLQVNRMVLLLYSLLLIPNLLAFADEQTKA
jgi:hypothetical protein